jgi:heat shock protein HslJ
LRHEHLIAASALTALLAAGCASTPDGAIATGSSSVSASSALSGTTWRLASIDGRPALAGVRVTAVFAGDEDRVAGSAGCNQYFGRAVVKGDRIEVDGLGSTRMFCTADGIMPQEADYLAALDKATVYRVANRQLQLGPASGVVTLVFDAE